MKWRSILLDQIYDPCFVESYVAPQRQGRVTAKADIHDGSLNPCYVELLDQYQVKANLVAPILHDDQFWGVLIAHHCAAPRLWQALEIDSLQQLSTQVSIAIQQAELYQQVQTLNTSLELRVQERTAQFQQALAFEAGLKRITDKVRDSLDESQILQAAVQELTLMLGLLCCDTALYDLSAATSTIQSEFTAALEGVSSPSAQGQVVSMTSLPESYHQLLQGEYFQFCELAEHSTRHRAILAYPLCDDQSVLGDLWLFKPKEEAFNELELRLVKQVANQCAIAIRQARLFQESQAQIEAL